MRQTTIEAIRSFDDSQFTAAILPKLKDNSPAVRETAIASLSRVNIPGTIDSLILSLSDKSLAVRDAAKNALSFKIAQNPSLTTAYPQLQKTQILKELQPLINEYKSQKGALVVVYEGWDDKWPWTSIRNPGWSEGLLLRDTLNVMNKLSGGKIEYREGNWSGNAVVNTQDKKNMADFVYNVWKEAKDSDRNFYVIGNSYANRMVPAAFEYAQTLHKNPRIKADKFIGTGRLEIAIMDTNYLRKASIQEPVTIGSWGVQVLYVTLYSWKRFCCSIYDL